LVRCDAVEIAHAVDSHIVPSRIFFTANSFLCATAPSAGRF
jgi:hypothetical protein